MEKNKNTSKKLAEKLYEIATTHYTEDTSRGEAIRRMATIIDLHIRNQQEERLQKQSLLPFDLGLVKQGAKVVTRDGYDVEIVADDLSGEYPVLATVIDDDGHKTFATFTLEGEYTLNRQLPHDLFILKEPETIDVGIYKHVNGIKFSLIRGSVVDINTHGHPSNFELIKTITVEL